MAAYLRRKKHINEAGEQPVAQQAAPAPATAPAAPAGNTQPQPAAQAPQQQAAPAPTPQQTAQPAAAQPDTQPAAPAQEQQTNPVAQKVSNFIKNTDEKIQANDIYWAITFNLPEELQKEVPEFKAGNPAAKTAIASWEQFKKTPSEETFKKFTDDLNSFAYPATPAQATQQQAQQESFNISFRDRLMENIEKFKTIDTYTKMIENGYKN